MAEQKLLKLTVSRVDAPVFDGEVSSVRVPGIEGEMEILPNHAPLISPLKEGVITITMFDHTTETQLITSGILEIHNNHATILF